MASTRFVAQERAVAEDVAPDKEEISEILGTSPATRFGGMSETQVNAFLSSPRNWFQSIGKSDTHAKPLALDAYAKILSAKDEALYRSIFKKIGAQDFTALPELIAQLEDRILIGHIEAGKLLRPNARSNFGALKDWLAQHKDLPQADDVFALAVKIQPGAKAELPKPNTVIPFSGSVERVDGGGVMLWNTDAVLKEASQGKDGSTFVKLLRQSKWKEASELLDNVSPAARLTYAELLLRRGKGKEAWEHINALDVAQLSAPARPYAAWIKGLVAYTAQHYGAAEKAFASVLEFDLSGPNKSGAAYWAARSAEASGKAEVMQTYLQKAAAYPRSFYGLLALTRINGAPQYNWAVPAFSKAQAELFKKDNAGRRALALLQVGERMLAEAELREIELRGSGPMKTAMLALVSRYSLPSLSVQIGSALGGGRFYDSALYPLMPWQPDENYVSDPALVLAIARNESHFNHVAKSPAGAVGVMQIMPQTAESMRKGASQELYDPYENVTLGDRYIEMLTRTEGIGKNLLFIIASYNCGPKRLLSLYESTKAQNGDDPLLFIETLPIKETRDYMQKVMATYWIYRARFDKPLKAMAELTVGRWPTYSKGDTRLVAASRE